MKKKSQAKKLTKRIKKKSIEKKKHPLWRKLVTYHERFEPAGLGESQMVTRVSGMDKGKVIIRPDFDEPLPEFES